MSQPTKAPRRPNGLPPIPMRSVRVPDELWEQTKDVANQNGETVSHVIVRALQDYVAAGK